MTGTTPPEREAGLPAAPSRNELFDGLRGVAIVLIVLSHVAIVWSPLERWDLGPFEGLLDGGNIGVSIFLVIGGFLVTRSLFRARSERGWTGPVIALARRTVRITIQVYALLAVVLLVARLDPTDTTPERTTLSSVRAVATYTWNEYVRRNALDARSDLGALYYLSIELQVYVALLVLVVVLWRLKALLALLIGMAIPLVTWWRWYVFDTQGWYQASLMATTRMDGLLYGILAALVMHRLRSLRPQAGGALGAGLLVVAATVVSCAFTGVDAYYGAQGVAITAGTALFVVAAASGPDPRSYAVRAMTWTPLTWLGRRSLTIFVWHLPAFALIARHTPDWAPAERTGVALTLLAAVVLVVDRFVAQPADRLVSRWWRGQTVPSSDRIRRWSRRAAEAPTHESFADDPLLFDDPRADLDVVLDPGPWPRSSG